VVWVNTSFATFDTAAVSVAVVAAGADVVAADADVTAIVANEYTDEEETELVLLDDIKNLLYFFNILAGFFDNEQLISSISDADKSRWIYLHVLDMSSFVKMVYLSRRVNGLLYF